MSKYTFEQFTATRSFTAARYSPDGTQVAYLANTSGEFNLWVMPSGGGFARQITSFSDRAVRSLCWSPDGARIAFTADHHGDEMHQVYLIDVAGGWPEQLTHAPEAQFTLGDFAPGGSALFITGNDAEPTEMQPQRLDLASRQVERLMTGGRHYASEVSPDGKHLVIVDFVRNTDQNLLVYSLTTGEHVNASPHDGEAKFWPGPWKKDGSGFYLLTNLEREYTGLAFYDLAAGAWSWLDAPEHDVEALALSEDGGTLVYLVNEAGRSQPRALSVNDHEALDVSALPLGVVTSLDVSPEGDKALLLFGSAKEASNIYEFDLSTGELRALEQSMLGGIRTEDLLEPDLIHYKSADGRDIPAWLYKPKDFEEACPVVVSIHGGPEAQERPSYAYGGLYQYWLDRGVGVLAPNIRGSTGYGVSYQKLIHRDWGGAELLDIERAAKYLRGLEWVDEDRVCVFGGSFGGFATLSALTRSPEYWAAGVDIVGPSNLVTFAKAVPPHWRAMMKAWVGDPEEDEAFLLERSPITYADAIRAPLLVIQGANDPRVVKTESDQMVATMREGGLEVAYYVDDKSGHGPTNREERNKWMKMSAEFILSQVGLADTFDLSDYQAEAAD